MNAFFRLVSSPAGRAVRGAVGLILIAVGVLGVHGVIGGILAVIGLVPLAAGVFDWCVLAPLFHLPFQGEQLRRALDNQQRV